MKVNIRSCQPFAVEFFMLPSVSMKCIVPEISWHNRDPVYTIDLQPKIDEAEKFYRLASGGADSHVVIWHLKLKENCEDLASVEFAADLDRHVKAVNVVRFSHDGESLASGSDDAVIIIWKMKKESTLIDSPSKDQKGVESWFSWKVLKGHLEDVYDLNWSSDGTKLFSGSVDNTALLWDVHKGRSLGIIGEHKGFVQGVAWDPKDKYLATMCTDRTLRIFSRHTKKALFKVTKANCFNNKSVSEQKTDEKMTKLFHDDTLKTFFRRLCFSPDGEILITPSGIMEDSNEEGKVVDVSYIFTRNSLNQPVLHLPSPGQYTVAARCCPTLFRLRDSEANLFALPYRIIFAIATKSTVIFYDTQQTQPFAFVSNIHYTGLTDISWSSDGRVLMVSSSEGYCSIIVFEENELGVPYKIATDEAKENISDINIHKDSENVLHTM